MEIFFAMNMPWPVSPNPKAHSQAACQQRPRDLIQLENHRRIRYRLRNVKVEMRQETTTSPLTQ
jgi:hypothetical protein